MANPPQTQFVGATAVDARSAAAAILVLDESGRILLADAGARALWRAGETGLNGEHFPALFALDAFSQDLRSLDSQWKALLSAAAVGPLCLTAQPRDGTRREVSVRLEKATFSSASGCIAFVQTVDAPAGEDLLTMLADRSPVGVFDLNFKAGTFYYSPAWKRQLGYADHELDATFETWRSVLHPEDSAAAPDRAAPKSCHGARGFSAEYRLRHKQGHYVWLHGIGLQVFGSASEIERVIGVHIDISERKEFEDAGMESEGRFAELSGQGPLGAFDLDFAAGCHWFSPAWKRLLGYTAEDLTDDSDALARALHPDDAPAGLKEFFLSRNPGQPVYLDLCRLRHRDGHYLWVLGGVSRRVSRKRELLRVTGFHVALPLELPAVGDRPLPTALLAAAFADLREGVIFADAAGRTTWVNDKAARLLRQAPDELRGLALGELLPLVHRATGHAAEFPVSRLFELGEAVPLNNDYALSRGDGAAAEPITFSARPVPDATGRTVGAVVILCNPEEITLPPEEVIKSDRLESPGVLAGGIAHDSDNLPTTIPGENPPAEDHRDDSRLADGEKAGPAEGPTQQPPAFAQGGTAGQTVLAPVSVLKEAARVAAAGATTEVSVDVAPGTGNILGDRGQLVQAFQNLVVNAFQAMPEGRPGHVGLRAANTLLAEGQIAPLAGGHYVQFEVRDDGCGIPPENLQTIFAESVTTRQRGSGRGLVTVLDIVRQHGGQIGVDSTVGTGTTFTVFLPRADQPSGAEAHRAPTPRFGTGRILFMDDDEKICALTGEMLQSLKYKFDVARKGEEAIALYKRYLNIGRPYDVVILDLTVIGGMGGEETFRKLRDLDPDVRAIVSSGYPSEDMAKQCLEMGFCGYLTKPYRAADLGRILKAVLG